MSKEFALAEPARFPCAKRASFGAKNEGIKRFCAAHKRPDDVNLNNKKTCGAPTCVTYPSFCDPGSRKAEYCARHRYVADLKHARAKTKQSRVLRAAEVLTKVQVLTKLQTGRLHAQHLI